MPDKRMRPYIPQTRRQHDDRAFNVFFVVVAVLTVAAIAGSVAAVIILFPHVIALLDRLGQ